MLLTNLTLNKMLFNNYLNWEILNSKSHFMKITQQTSN